MDTSILAKDTLAHGQKEPGIDPLTFQLIDDPTLPPEPQPALTS